MCAGSAAIAVLIAGTRVLLGVHWLTDVVAGLVLGWAWFAVCSFAFGGRSLRFAGGPRGIATGRTTHVCRQRRAAGPRLTPVRVSRGEISTGASEVALFDGASAYESMSDSGRAGRSFA
jgi:hypothetical protein